VGSPKIKIIKLLDLMVGSFIARLVPGRKDQQRDPRFIQRILIIRPGGMGDAVFLIPFLRSFKEHYPALLIDVLCEKRNQEVFRSQEHLVNKVYRYDSLRSFLGLWRNKFDVIIDTEQWHILSALVAYFLFFKHTIGFATRPLRAKLFTERIGYDPEAYELKNFQKLFQGILPKASQIEDIEGCFSIDAETLTWAQNTVRPQSVSVFLGASIAIRRLNQSQSLELVRFILQKNFYVILLGGRDVLRAAAEIEKEISDERVKNFIGKTSLMESAALIKHSKAFVGPDSGLMHLACAVGTPVVAIFGPGNFKKWGPQGSKHKVVTENVECSPCTRFGYTVPTCNGTYFCMGDIKIKSITDKISEFFSASV